MIVLSIILTIAITSFILTFFKMIKDNNSNYTYLLTLEFIGIIILFFYIFNGKEPNSAIYILTSILAIFIPLINYLFERKDIHLIEIIKINYAKIRKKDELDTILKAIDNNKDSYYAHKQLAEYYEKNKEYEKAEDEYIEVIQLKPNDYKSHLKLAEILEKNNQNEQAIIILKRLLEGKPDYLQGSIMLGNILYNDGKFKEASSVYLGALKYNPREYDLYYRLGMTYTRLNDFKNAEEFYKKAAQINSLKEISDLNLGQIYMIFEEYDEAEKYFSECIKYDDNEIEAFAYYYLAKIKLLQKSKDNAIMYINMAIELEPSIYNIVEKEDIFLPILSEIAKRDSKIVKSKLNKEQIGIIDYLNNTSSVVENLTNDNSVLAKQERYKDVYEKDMNDILKNK